MKYFVIQQLRCYALLRKGCYNKLHKLSTEVSSHIHMHARTHTLTINKPGVRPQLAKCTWFNNHVALAIIELCLSEGIS